MDTEASRGGNKQTGVEEPATPVSPWLAISGAVTAGGSTRSFGFGLSREATFWIGVVLVVAFFVVVCVVRSKARGPNPSAARAIVAAGLMSLQP